MLRALILLLSLVWLSPGSAMADVLSIRKDAPQTYVVKKGDTLWDLSAIYLEKPWQWPQLWQWNPQIKNPHLIYPGDKLSLSYDANGKPQLLVNGGNTKGKLIKLSPKKRVTVKKTAIPTLPLRVIRPYISYEQSLDGEYLDSLPTVIGSTSRSKNWIPGQTLYVNKVLDPAVIYALYRKGQVYTNPGEDEPLGYETALVATVRVLRPGNETDPAAVEIISAMTEIKAGDKLLPANEGQELPAYFHMSLPQVELDGTIIASPDKFREFSKYDVVVLNLGEQHEIKVGNMLGIYQRSPTVVNDPDNPHYLEDASRFSKMMGEVMSTDEDIRNDVVSMPREKVGELMVFKVFEKISYAFITAANRPVRVGDSTASLKVLK